MTKSLCCNLIMFGIILTVPASVYCDNEAVYKNVPIPDSVLNKKYHSVSYHACRYAIASDMIRVAKEDTMTNLDDLFIKPIPEVISKRLLDMFMY